MGLDVNFGCTYSGIMRYSFNVISVVPSVHQWDLDIYGSDDTIEWHAAKELRTLNICHLFSTLILRNAYQGSLFDHIQSQIEARPVDTLAKVSQYN